VVALLALATLLPFFSMIATALMGEFEPLRSPPPLLPARPHLENFAAVLGALPFARFFLNSVVFAGAAVAGQVLTSAAAAYAFARLRFPGRDRVFVAFLAVLVVPAAVLLIPRFLLVRALGGLDGYAGLVSTELVSVGGIFLLRQCFLGLPRDLEDAARLDGAGEWTIFWRVALPLSTPALATLAVFGFVEEWKNFVWPLVATRSIEMQVAELGVASVHGLYPATWPYQMAAAVTAMVPMLVLYFVAQRYFMRGMALAAPR